MILSLRLLCVSGLVLSPASLHASPTSLLWQSEPSLESVGLATKTSRGLLEISVGGVPLLGEPFHVEVHGAQPGALGALFTSPVELGLFLPAFGATLYPGAPLSLVPFVADSTGSSPRLADMAAVPASLDGLFASMQAVVLDPGAQAGLAASRGGRVVFGSTDTSQAFPIRSIPATTGFSAASSTQGDWNSDGLMDYAVSGPGGIAILLGQSDGSFGAPQLVPGEAGGTVIANADMNADGILDLVAEESQTPNPTTTKILTGNGDGSFVLADEVPGPLTRLGLEIADFDQDGALDVAYVDLVLWQLEVRLGNGDGTFGALKSTAVFPTPDGIALGDVDGDGILDVVLNSGAGILTGIGVGDGTFAFLATQVMFPISGPIALDDVDGDLDLDLLGIHPPSSTQPVVVIFDGEGDGTFPQSTHLAALGACPTNPQFLDVDDDGIMDIVVDDVDISAVEITYGLGGGVYESPLRVVIGNAGTVGNRTFIDDRDGDGNKDLVVFGSLASDLTTIYSQANRTFAGNHSMIFGRDSGQTGLSDQDGDQVLDLVVVSNNAVLVLPGLGDGNFGLNVLSPLTTSQIPAAYCIADLDADGLDEVLLSLTTGVSLLRSDGALGFQPAESLTTRTLISMVILDVDGDGIPDLVGGVDDGSVPITGHGLAVYPGLGDGTFGVEQLFATSQVPQLLEPIALDLDGFIDLVLVDSSVDQIVAMTNQGNGTFLETGSTSFGASGSQASDLLIADWNEDGLGDLALVLFDGGANLVLPGNGNGTSGFDFGPTLQPSGARNIAAADWNGDRLLDLVVSSDPGVTVYFGTGDGSFPTSSAFGIPHAQPEELHIGDLDGDFLPDVVIPTRPSFGIRGSVTTTLNALLGR